jgi:S-adenosylmethionine-diacylgycerolhomoserine-N-methlytransferase
MMLLQDSRILLHLLRGHRAMGGSHADRLQDFYAPQAAEYDRFRERLLPGRKELIERLAPMAGDTVIELGGGTGRNIEYFGARLLSLNRFELVDLCPALLQQAEKRASQWPALVKIIQADATTYKPSTLDGQGVDRVYFSYSLTMIPEWRRAINNALRMLRPGGLIGAVDFYVSASEPRYGLTRHGWMTRQFWPRWFRHDGVRLSPDHLPELMSRTEPVHCEEGLATLPYLPGLRVPYYIYVGRKAGR